MAGSIIAAQMFTLRDYLKTPADIAVTMKKIRQVGYEAVQLSGLGKIDPTEMSKILKGEGLAVAATHISLDRMKNDTAAVIDEHKLWGCEYTALGAYVPKEPSADDWVRFGAEYSDVAKKFDGSGITIGYHNHSHELQKFSGKTALEILLKTCSPSIWFEIDTYWITHGGGDPAAFIKLVSGRIPCVHLKDMAIKQGSPQFMAEVGEGNLNWPAILPACKAAGVKWYIVEQDTCYRDPFESLGISLKNLQAMGLK